MKSNFFGSLLFFLLSFFEVKSLAEITFLRTEIDTERGPPASACSEVQNIPMTKSQGSLNLCYAFSVSTLLEHYRCEAQKLDCSKPQEQISPLDVSARLSQQNQEIVQSGHTAQLLKNLEASSDKSFVPETCAPYSGLVLKNRGPQGSNSEAAWWNEMTNLFNSEHRAMMEAPRGTYRCNKGALISDQFTNRANEVFRAISTSQSPGEFIYRAAIPLSCKNPEIAKTVPDFNLHNYPEDPSYKAQAGPKDFEIMTSQIKKLVAANKLMQMSACTDLKPGTSTCISSHAIVIGGIKSTPPSGSPGTTKGGCNFSLKVLNSWGASWQNQHNGGWVNGCEFLTRAYQLPDGAKLNWIDSPSGETQPRSAASCVIAKAAIASVNRALMVLPKPLPFKIPDLSLQKSQAGKTPSGKKIYWKCQGGGYTAQPQVGKKCVRVEI
jgi:hypothetical protein